MRIGIDCDGVLRDLIPCIIDGIKEPVYVVNIDHHHDIQYHDTDPLYRGFLSGNWLGHYLINKKVSGATWIANYNSLSNAFQNFFIDS